MRPSVAPVLPVTSVADLEAKLREYMSYSGATLTLDAPDASFSLYDFYGNPVPAKNGKIMLQNGTESVFYKYQNTTFNAGAGKLTLNNLEEIPGGTGTGPAARRKKK